MLFSTLQVLKNHTQKPLWQVQQRKTPGMELKRLAGSQPQENTMSRSGPKKMLSCGHKSFGPKKISLAGQDRA